jgi:dTDP-4-amino-4,6-dideoxy-D-glucose acyltransferase
MDLPPEFCPGGLLSREELRFLNACGRDVRIFHGVRMVPPERISIGDFTQVDEGARIYAGQGVQVGRFVHLAVNSVIFGGGTCEIDDFASIGANVSIVTGSDLPLGGLANPTIPRHFRAVERSSIRIGRHALLYTGVIVLPGVEIPEGTVVGAGAIVHRSLRPWAIYAGNPPTQVGDRDWVPIVGKATELLATPPLSHD